MSGKSSKHLIKHNTPQYLNFEGIKIQWNKVPWNFDHPDLGTVSIDTYSVWNPSYHAEIADRLAQGQRCALYMMGNFGVGEFFQDQDEVNFEILDKIKQRDRIKNLCVFAHPADIGDYIDVERLPDAFAHLEVADKRLAAYPGPMHAILPVKEWEMPNSGLVKTDDKSAAFFWIPGHFGYEQLVLEVKKRSKKGFFGGGSLNIHGQKPSFTTQTLREEMAKYKMWQENVQFVIFDELAEAEGIGRSHTQVSFLQHPAQVLRIGSLSPERIGEHLGYGLAYNPESVKYASSITPYDEYSNQIIEKGIEAAIARMGRFQSSKSSSGPQI